MEPDNWFQSSNCSIEPMSGKTSLIFASCEDCPYEEILNAYKSEDRPDLVFRGLSGNSGLFGKYRDRLKSVTSKPLSPTGSALARTDLSPLTNGIWEIHAGCSCFLRLQLLAKIGYIP